MPIISSVGRKNWKVRLLINVIYIVLSLGALSMIYPFMIMIAGSSKSAVDTPDAEVIPAFVTKDKDLWQKFTESLFNESFEQLKTSYRNNDQGFRYLELPNTYNPELANNWEMFCKEKDFPFYYYMIGEVYVPMTKAVMPRLLRKFKNQLNKRFDGNISELNDQMDAEFVDWNSFYYIAENYLPRRMTANQRPLDKAFREFKSQEPICMRYYFSPEGYFNMVYLRSRFNRDIKKYNKLTNKSFKSWSEIPLSQKTPQGTDAEKETWENFVRYILNLYWIKVDQNAQPEYQKYLEAKYDKIITLNKAYNSSYADWSEIPLITVLPHSGIIHSDWSKWIEGWKDPETGRLYAAPINDLRILAIDFMYRDWLKNKYKTIASVNQALNTKYQKWSDIIPPQEQLHYRYFQKNKSSLRKEFLIRNFISVLNYVAIRGRAIWNTVIYCSLAILCALIFNPLAAYALSRYKPPSEYKILLLMMLTMSFPPMVTMIPVFLMLREFNLLNTFWALILPGLANGYSVFLLKGFFDSLPRELYESAEIDGAGEFRIFWQITMSLSKPILAVIALNAFTMAYGNFMMALLICQDQTMWTLMPWLFQLQMRSGQGIVYASLLISSIPTFLIFAFCQNIIMKGIVVPVEK